jgi:hypothetical protein
MSNNNIFSESVIPDVIKHEINNRVKLSALINSLRDKKDSVMNLVDEKKIINNIKLTQNKINMEHELINLIPYDNNKTMDDDDISSIYDLIVNYSKIIETTSIDNDEIIKDIYKNLIKIKTVINEKIDELKERSRLILEFIHKNKIQDNFDFIIWRDDKPVSEIISLIQNDINDYVKNSNNSQSSNQLKLIFNRLLEEYNIREKNVIKDINKKNILSKIFNILSYHPLISKYFPIFIGNSSVNEPLNIYKDNPFIKNINTNESNICSFDNSSGYGDGDRIINMRGIYNSPMVDKEITQESIHELLNEIYTLLSKHNTYKIQPLQYDNFINTNSLILFLNNELNNLLSNNKKFIKTTIYYTYADNIYYKLILTKMLKSTELRDPVNRSVANYIYNSISAIQLKPSEMICVKLSSPGFRRIIVLLDFFKDDIDAFLSRSKNLLTFVSKINDWPRITPEEAENYQEIYKKTADNSLIIDRIDKNPTELQPVKMSIVLGPEDSNTLIPKFLGISSLLDKGEDVVIFTQGYSGSGKTVTLFGINKFNATTGKTETSLNGLLQDTIYAIADIVSLDIEIMEIYGRSLMKKENFKTEENYIDNIMFIVNYIVETGEDKMTVKYDKIIEPNLIKKYLTERNKLTQISIQAKDVFIQQFSSVIDSIDSIRRDVLNTIRPTVNNKDSSRSIIFYSFHITYKDSQIKSKLTIIDPPGKENIYETFVKNSKEKKDLIAWIEKGIVGKYKNPVKLMTQEENFEDVPSRLSIIKLCTFNPIFALFFTYKLNQEILDLLTKMIPRKLFIEIHNELKTMSIYSVKLTELFEFNDDGEINTVPIMLQTFNKNNIPSFITCEDDVKNFDRTCLKRNRMRNVYILLFLKFLNDKGYKRLEYDIYKQFYENILVSQKIIDELNLDNPGRGIIKDADILSGFFKDITEGVFINETIMLIIRALYIYSNNKDKLLEEEQSSLLSNDLSNPLNNINYVLERTKTGTNKEPINSQFFDRDIYADLFDKSIYKLRTLTVDENKLLDKEIEQIYNNNRIFSSPSVDIFNIFGIKTKFVKVNYFSLFLFSNMFVKFSGKQQLIYFDSNEDIIKKLS